MLITVLNEWFTIADQLIDFWTYWRQILSDYNTWMVG